MGILRKLFSKAIRVKEDDLQKYFCVKGKKSGKKIYLNTKLEVPENVTCTFCYKNKPCETLNTGVYELNGNSLPILYKKGKFNKPNKKNYIPNYFFANIWFASKNNKWIEFDINKFVVKDNTYGRQKICLALKVNICIDDAGKFFKCLLYDRPHISSRKVLGAIVKWMQNDIRKYLKHQCYNIDDYMCHTERASGELQQYLSNKFTPMGLSIVETVLEDIVMDSELIREISDNRDLSFRIHSNMKDFDIAMNNDGLKSEVNFARSEEQLRGSVAEKYRAKAQSEEDKIDYFDNGTMIGQNQGAGNFTTSRFGEICDKINLSEGESVLGDLQLKENGQGLNFSSESGQNATMQGEEEIGLKEEENYNSNPFTNKNKYNPYDLGGDILPAKDEESEAMYDEANQSLCGGFEDAYSALYGKPTAFKICTKCNRQVPIYASFCPYCGNGDLKHNL